MQAEAMKALRECSILSTLIRTLVQLNRPLPTSSRSSRINRLPPKPISKLRIIRNMLSSLR